MLKILAKTFLLVAFGFSSVLLSAQDCDCVPKDEYEYVEYSSRYRTLQIPIECDSLFSMVQINAFLNFSDIFYEVAGDFFGWAFPHPKSLETTVNPSLQGAGTGTGGTGYGMSYFGKNLNGFDTDTYASEINLLGTIIHEGIHRWDFRGQNYFQGPDIAHPLTVGLQDYLGYKTGMNYVGVYSNETGGISSDLEIKRRYKYFWRRYLNNPNLNWEYYFQTGQSNEDIYVNNTKPEAYERLAIQGATLLSIIFMHGESELKDIFQALENMRLEDPSWGVDLDKYSVLNRHIRAFGDGLKVDVSDYFDYWKYPVSDEMRNYLSKYPKSEKIQDLDGDGFSPLQGDLDDGDDTVYPDAPELLDGLDNNQDGQIDENVISEKDGDLSGTGDGPQGDLPLLVQGELTDLDDEDAFHFVLQERSLVSIVFTSLDSDTIIQHPNFKMGIFDAVLNLNGYPFIRQDVASGENNIHKTNWLNPGNYRMKVTAKEQQGLTPGSYEVQIFVNQQGPVILEKNGFTFKHQIYNNSTPDLNFDPSQVKGVSMEEASVLKQIYQENEGEKWADSRGWLASEDVCYWRGIHCDRTGISKLNLNGERHLQQALDSTTLVKLRNLRELDISGANFQKMPLPDVFGTWKNLSMLRASYNNIKGPLPESLGDKKKLWFVELVANQFEGSIPDSWSNNTQLTYLHLGGNNLSGALPIDFHQLKRLKEFYFDTDKVCVPNQAVWDWIQKIPQLSEGVQRCHEAPTAFTMLSPIDQSFDLSEQPEENLQIKWTESVDPENVDIQYTWVIGTYTNQGSESYFAPIWEIKGLNNSELNISKTALADSLAKRGFSDQLEQYYHFALASDGDWLASTDTVSVILKLQPSPCLLQAKIEVQMADCYREYDGSATVLIENGFGPFQYAWNDGSTDQNLQKLAAGSYEVSVSDLTGCSSIARAFLKNTPLEIELETNGPNLNITSQGGTSPYQYRWDDGTEGAQRALSNEETWSLMVMDAQGCQGFFLSPPIIQAPKGISTDAFVANWKAVPGANAYQIRVSKDKNFTELLSAYDAYLVENKTFLEISGLDASKEYFYQVAAINGDSRSDYSSSAIIQLNQTSCSLFVEGSIRHILRGEANNSGAINLSVKGGDGNYTYNWDNGQSSASIRSNLLPDQYNVQVTDGNDCTGSSIFEIQRLERMAFGNRVWHDLNRNGIQEDGEPGIAGVKVYFWEDQDNDGIPEGSRGFRETNENGIFRMDDLEPGRYVAFVWEIDNFDPGGPLFEMLNSPGDLDPDNDLPFDDNGEPGGINNPQPYRSVTSKAFDLFPATEPLQDGDPTGEFFDVDPNGNMTIDFGFYKKDECPDMSARFEGDLYLCPDQSSGKIQAIAIKAIGPVRYKWNRENPTPFLKDAKLGTYEVLIKDAVGCEQSVSVEVKEFQDLTLESSISPETLNNTTKDGGIIINTELNGYSFAWSNGSSNKNLENVPAGDYQLTISSANGCSKVFDFVVDFITSVNSIDEEIGLELFPNPSGDFIQLKTSLQKSFNDKLSGSIVALDGKVLFQFQDLTLAICNQRLREKSHNLASGAYILQIRSKSGVGQQKFIINRN